MRKRDFKADLKPRGQAARIYDRNSWRTGSAEQRFKSEWESALDAMRRRGEEGGIALPRKPIERALPPKPQGSPPR
jgi:hypothetical protein